jgi:hypothetical protein
MAAHQPLQSENEQIFHIETADGEDASSIIHLSPEDQSALLTPQKWHRIGFTHSSVPLPLREALGEACGNLPQLRLQVLAERTFPVDGLEHLRLV